MKKLPLLAAAAVGYVLGARAGRARYEQIAVAARKVADDPRVKRASHKAQDAVAHQASVAAEAAKDKVTSAASSAADKVRGTDTTGTTGTTGTQTPIQATP